MQPVIIVILLFGAVFLSWLAQSQLNKKLTTKLLKYEKSGDQKSYFNLLKSPITTICLSKRTRLLLTLDYYLAYEDRKGINKVVLQLVDQPVNLVKDKDTLIYLMRSYLYFLENKDLAMVEQLEVFILDNCELSEVKSEINILHQVYLAPSEQLITQLEEQLKSTDRPEQKLIIYQRLNLVAEQLGNEQQAEKYLTRMQELAKNNIKLEKMEDF